MNRIKSLFASLFVLCAGLTAGDVFAQRQGLLGRRPFLRSGNTAGRGVSEVGRDTGSAQSEAAPSTGTKGFAFNDASLGVIFGMYMDLTNKTILKDPEVKDVKITFETAPNQEFSDEEKIETIEVLLEMNDIHLEPYGEKFVRALPRKEVRKKGIPLILDADAKLKERERVVSMMIPLKNISTEDAQKALEGFKSNSGILVVFERTNSILVTDTEQNINRMLEIVKMIDVANPVNENVFVRQIKNAAAEDIKAALVAIVEDAQKEQEKNGKSVIQQRPQTHNFTVGRSLLSRRQPQPAAPASNESLVVGISDADRGMIRGKVLILSDERSNKLIIVTQKSNMDFFDKVIDQLDVETTPDTVVKVYRLKYAEAEEVSDMINDLIGNAPNSKNSGKNQNQAAKSGSGGNLTRNQPAAARKSVNQRAGEAKAGELSKDNTTVLADKRINGLVVMTNKELVPIVESIIESMDIKLSQVLIETVIIEVGLGDDLKTGIDWVQRGAKDANGADTLVNRNNYMLGGGGGNAAGLLEKMSNVGSNLANNVQWGGATPIGSGINYLVKSDKLNLSAVIQASKTDSRTKYIASPIIMTLDNKEATIDATEMRYMFKGYTYSGSTYNGSAVPDYEQKDLGIKIKVTPKINPNGTVMLEVEEEYSQEGAGQAITASDGKSEINAATTITRKMAADAILENRQTVIFGGLTQTVKSEKETGIPILKDIPYVGKWLFGTTQSSESRSELLVFMTPYVLDDAESAQAEALRRKKTLSDASPWDDHGWSASKLADPVGKKELIRRMKDEWKKQDADRAAKLEMEKMKLDRAKKLKELSAEERAVWLKMHKEELEKEEREELEEKMLDKDSQEGLRKLVEEIKKEKLGSAQKEIDKAEEMTRAENERAKLDAAEAEKKSGKSERSKADADESADILSADGWRNS